MRRLRRQCPWPIHICTNTHIKVYNLRLLYFYVYVYVFRCVYGYGYVYSYIICLRCRVLYQICYSSLMGYYTLSAYTLLIYCVERTYSVIGTYIGVERFLIVSVEYGIRNFLFYFRYINKRPISRKHVMQYRPYNMVYSVFGARTLLRQIPDTITLLYKLGKIYLKY